MNAKTVGVPTLADPRLQFGENVDIAEGVVVQPIDYPEGQSHPPFTSTVFVVAPGRSSPLDRHEVAETWVILNGTGMLDYEGTTLRLSRLDKLFFPSLHAHQVTNDAQAPLEILSVYWPVRRGRWQSDDMSGWPGKLV